MKTYSLDVSSHLRAFFQPDIEIHCLDRQSRRYSSPFGERDLREYRPRHPPVYQNREDSCQYAQTL